MFQCPLLCSLEDGGILQQRRWAILRGDRRDIHVNNKKLPSHGTMGEAAANKVLMYYLCGHLPGVPDNRGQAPFRASFTK